MDVFGTVVNVTTLVGQIVIIYRHVAAMQSFGDAAEGVTAKISFEYFRFETWAEQSGYLEIKDRDGLTSEAAQSAQSNTGSHYLLQTAAKAHEIVAQIQNVLAATRLLLEKNQISDKLTDAAGSTSLQPDLSVTQPSIIAKTTARQQFLSLPSSVSSMPAIERATAASSKLKLRLGKETGRLRKLRFSWGLFGEDSDMAKLEDLVQQLRYWNDGLRDILPIQHQLSHGMMTQVRVLGHLNNHQALERVGNASRSISGTVYQDIYASCNMKRDKLNTGPQFNSHIKADSGPLDVTRLPQLSGSSSASIEYRLTSLHSGQGMESEATRVVVEIVDFSAISHQDSLEILNTRIGRLSHLLRAAARPSNLYLPTCEGYVRASASKFFILYRPPEQADPFKQPRTLLCLLPRHPNAPKRPPRMPILPSLEERYSLAKQLAEGLLRLHSISWLHKCFNSNNILFFHSPDGLSISHPVLVGFGLGRTSDKTSETIDVRQLGSHFDLYQHPELRADAHKRYKKRHDIYSLGLVLFEIGIWQSIFYFKKDNQDAQDFRRTIRNACESHLAHFMGKAYQRAVLQCLDEDDMWKEAEGDDDDDDSSEIHEVFFWKVVRELGGVQ
ncbi:hypothetical protein D7B24_002885 [Verticillium nonalfalfae]|uniref:Protein kinase domain-containing protein n=1 Tax=Verticillium nonalfalfae TaxID=1051616 RepID=A0A3M9XYS5_9PEZI|nr:uncharacterized protein D7B24_002885 [Verticillium nonalfalfae]RNJ52776.1 hypothetical protein D7B24_002885 [Verticillium nonalfalfae]